MLYSNLSNPSERDCGVCFVQFCIHSSFLEGGIEDVMYKCIYLCLDKGEAVTMKYMSLAI